MCYHEPAWVGVEPPRRGQEAPQSALSIASCAAGRVSRGGSRNCELQGSGIMGQGSADPALYDLALACMVAGSANWG